MDVKRGYKRTEVGVVPDDWDIRPCSAISNLITVGIVIRPAQYYVKQGVPALRSANIREDGIDDTEMVFISDRANALLSKSQVRAGDVLTVRTGYPGTSAVVPPSFAGSNCIDILITRPSKAVSSEFLTAWINSSFGKQQVLRHQGGLAQQHFNVADLRNLIVALPPLLEQQAIAETLSDADVFIESLEQLIAKKYLIKQGAMQELLTGKKRLPEFDGKAGYKQTEAGVIPEDWSTMTLEAAVQKDGLIRGPFGGMLKKDSFVNRGYKVYEQRNAIYGTLEMGEYFVNSSKFRDLERFRVKPGDFIVSCSGTIGCIYQIPSDAPDGIINQALLKITLNSERVDDRFFLAIFRAQSFQQRIKENSHGGAMQNLVGMDTFRKTQFQLPPTKAEQEAIAEALFDVDAEIAALEMKLAKARALKQGMMQELLTGRIRLV